MSSHEVNNSVLHNTFDSFDAEKVNNPDDNWNPSDEDFDPFGIAKAAEATKKTKSRKKDDEEETGDYLRISRVPSSGASVTPSVSSRGSVALPPRLIIKFKLHEEVSSVANLERGNEGASEVYVRGTLHVRFTHMTNTIATLIPLLLH